MAISDGACNVRSWIGNPDLEELKDPETGRANIKAAVGRGTLQVVKVSHSLSQSLSRQRVWGY